MPPRQGGPQAEFLQRFPQLALLRLRQRLRLRDLKEGNGQAVPAPWEHLPHLPLALVRQRRPPRHLKGAEEKADQPGLHQPLAPVQRLQAPRQLQLRRLKGAKVKAGPANDLNPV